MLIAGGMSINAVNRELARRNLALKTSGASDGQSFAGAIATGTHGADMKVGALHDTVVGIHLVNSPTTSVLLQAAGGGLTDRAAETLATWFGIPCQTFSNDELFRASLVHLGSLGVVLNVLVETVPLYVLNRQSSPHREGDARWRAVLSSREPGNADAAHPANPDCLSLILNPYRPEPSDDPRAWVISMRKRGFQGQPGVITTPTDVSLKSDLADFLPALVHVYEADIELPANPLLRAITSSQLRSLYGATSRSASALPAAMFGPPDFLGIDFDPLRGASAEYVFDAAHASEAVETILDTLAAQAEARNQYLGGVGVRFVRGSTAWLAPNAKPLNCFVELQSLYTDELPAIHTAIGAALTQAGIAYCGHWGQWALNTPTVVQSWWSESAVNTWKSARAALLPTPAARAIFASPILASAGLG
jgi:FAD/FMN-containing dehydrogenase